MPPKYISSKEASEISGYDPDYIGQLIRQGKLEGKPVYRSIAWMTTEEAVREYVDKKKGKKKETTKDKVQQAKRRFFLDKNLSLLFKGLLYFAIGILAGFTLLLFYIFSVNIDNKLQERAVESVLIDP